MFQHPAAIMACCHCCSGLFSLQTPSQACSVAPAVAPDAGGTLPAAAAAAAAAAADPAAAAAVDLAAGTPDSAEELQPVAGEEVDAGLLSPPGTERRTSPRLQAQRQQQQQQIDQQQPFAFPGVCGGSPGALDVGQQPQSQRQSARQQERRLNAQQQQQQQLVDDDDNEQQQDEGCADAADAAFQEALEMYQTFITSGACEEEAYGKMEDVYGVRTLLVLVTMQQDNKGA